MKDKKKEVTDRTDSQQQIQMLRWMLRSVSNDANTKKWGDNPDLT